MKKDFVSIIIPNYFMNVSGKIIQYGDEQEWFARYCFEKIRKYTKLPYELILIDNGSVHSQELLRKYADVLIVNRENLGFAKAVNQGIRIAKGEWIIQMNNDIWVWDGWLEAARKAGM